MGSCVSLHRDREAALKLRLSFGSKKDKLVNPSPEKQNIPAAGDAVLKSHWSPAQFGSKEETFFDSQAWLDSDCDDDFLSVNGDFTPSRGNTPVHERLSVKPPGSNGLVFATMTEPSPSTKKKRLSELFQDSVGGDDGKVDAAGPIKSGETTPSASSVNPSGEMKPPPLEKSTKEVQCCLPRMHSFKERKKRT